MASNNENHFVEKDEDSFGEEAFSKDDSNKNQNYLNHL